MAKGIYEREGKNGDVTYYIRYQFQGTDIKERVGRKSRGFTRETAKEALKSRLGDIARGQFNLEKTRKPVPFSKLVERYREFASSYKRGWETEKYIVEEFASLFGDTPLAQITTWQIEKWKAEGGKRLNPVTVNRRLTVIKHMFKQAVEWDLVKSNPATSVKRFTVNSERTRFLTQHEIQTLLETCEKQITSPWLLPLVTLALNTGMRQGELLRLKWENVDLERGSITIIQSKTLRRKTIAINEPAGEALNWLQENRYGELLLMWPWGDPIGKVTVYDAFKKACSTAGISDFRFHDLRHTFASHLVMAGVDLVTVKELLGHKTINMTNRYTHLAQEHKAQAVAKLGERIQGERNATESQSGSVSEELKQAINAVLPPNVAQNRNIFLVRRGRGLGISNEIKQKVEAASGFEPLHRGFADLSLNH
ncbi:MAG: site-specific integrase [Deltaproteobacteria bacterium]|nr:site-specific integrase [Deltaproteobacteria bacterium]